MVVVDEARFFSRVRSIDDGKILCFFDKMLRLRKLVGWGKRLAYWKPSLSLRLFFVFSLVAASSVFAKCASYGGCLVSLFTGRVGDEFVVKAVKRGVKRGVLPVVYLALMGVFMSVILADPVSAG